MNRHPRRVIAFTVAGILMAFLFAAPGPITPAVMLAGILVSLPLTLALRGMLADHLGRSLAADSAAAGANYDWMQEFATNATGIGATFKPSPPPSISMPIHTAV